MKKWLMLALLPLLLLVQQEAGANLSTKVFQSNLPGDLGYTAKFTEIDDNDTHDGYDRIEIEIVFGSLVDLTVASKVIPTGEVSDSLLTDQSLMTFLTLSCDYSVVPPVCSEATRIVNLVISDDTVSSGQNQVNNPEFDLSSNEMTGYVDLIGGDSELADFGTATCMLTKGMIDTVTMCPFVPITQVPVANSLLLMGIGLMALGIPLHRGRLS